MASASVDTLPFVVVDDTDTDRIKYEGDWRPVSSEMLQNINRWGDGGPPFRGLREITSNGSLTFTFSGRHVEIYGSNNDRRPEDPVLECTIDGESSPPDDRWWVRNGARFCQAYDLKEGQHQITMKTTTFAGKPLYFDFIQYVPEARANLDREYIRYDSSDPIIAYTGDWASPSEMRAAQTTQNGAFAEVTFAGTSFMAVGAVLNTRPPSTVTYSVDGRSDVTITIQASDANTIPGYGQRLVEVNDLKPGRHTIKMTYRGSSDSTPLLFDYVAIQHEPATPGQPDPNTPSDSVSGSSVSFTPRPTPSDRLPPPPPSDIPSGAVSLGDSGSFKESISIGAIVGGILGGLAILVAGFLAFYYIRRQTKRRSRYGSLEINPASLSDEVARPFNDNMSTPMPTTIHYNRPTTTSVNTSTLPGMGSTTFLQKPPHSQLNNLAAFPAQRNDKPVQRALSQRTTTTQPPAYTDSLYP